MDHQPKKHCKYHPHPHPPMFYVVCYCVCLLSSVSVSVSVSVATNITTTTRTRSTTTASFCSDNLCGPLTTKTHPSIGVQETDNMKSNNKKEEMGILEWTSSSSSSSGSESESRSNRRRRRRYLRGGPGSSPPRCISKCGRCTPCKPVHVAVPPGTPVTAEYYPEAWRCKCGNKLYMP